MDELPCQSPNSWSQVEDESPCAPFPHHCETTGHVFTSGSILASHSLVNPSPADLESQVSPDTVFQVDRDVLCNIKLLLKNTSLHFACTHLSKKLGLEFNSEILLETIAEVNSADDKFLEELDPKYKIETCGRNPSVSPDLRFLYLVKYISKIRSYCKTQKLIQMRELFSFLEHKNLIW